MYKKVKIYVIFTILILIALFGLLTFVKTKDIYFELEKTSLKNILNQDYSGYEGYYVYFYKKDCPFCKKLEEDILVLNNKSKLFIVDIEKFYNKAKNYDWEKDIHNLKKIGTINEFGEITYINGESKEKYINVNETNKYGKSLRYEFINITKDNYKAYEDFKIGDICVKMVTPEIDYSNLTEGKQLILAGVPSLFYIQNGKIKEFYFDTIEIQELVKNNL